jgi:hypothetical protein
LRQRIIHGTEIDVATPEEVQALIAENARRDDVRHIRATADVILDATGSGTVEVYKAPIGMTFELRRCILGLSTATDPFTGNVLFSAGHYVRYRRSGASIEFAIPLAPTAIAQVPGMQSWAREEGPIIANGEEFEVQAVGLTAGASFLVGIEGLLFSRDRR